MALLSSYSSYKHFLVSSPAPFVAHVEINRPEKLNAFMEAMWLELRSVFQQLSHDTAIRVVVLSGAGDRAFTSGLDVQAATAPGSPLRQDEAEDGARHAARLRRYLAEFQDCLSAVEKCEKPVICVMHGACLGLAIDLACCTDIRFSARNTRFSVKEVDIGLAADIGTLSRLPKLVSSFSWVKDICLSARDFSSEEARSQGFVSEVFDSKEKAVDAAVKLATLIAGKSPVAVQGTKELLNYSRDHTVENGLRYTQVWNSAALQTADINASVMSMFSKSKPTFEKL